MKKAFSFLLLLFFIIESFASTVTGLTTDKLVVWNIWEYKDKELKQYLILHNKDTSQMGIEIRIKDLESSEFYYKHDSGDSVYHNVAIKAGEILKVAYPKNDKQPEYLVFFKDKKYIGILSFIAEQPPRSFLRKKFFYYSNTTMNSRRIGCWLRTKITDDSKVKLGIAPIIFKKDEFMFIKFLKENEQLFRDYLDATKFIINDSLYKLHSDPDFIKSNIQPDMVLKKRTKTVVLNLDPNISKNPYLTIPFYVIYFEYHDILRKHRLYGAGEHRIAIFNKALP